MIDQMPHVLVMLAVALVAALAPLSASAAPPSLAEWKGEYFEKRQGALYLKVGLKGFKASKQSSSTVTNVQITITNLLKKRDFLVSHELQDVEAGPRTVWKLPSGKYTVKQLEMVDAAGVRRTWKATKKRAFSVKRLCISNLGLWTLSPKGEDGLSVKFAMVANSYRETGSKKDSSVAAVVNGFNGLIQEKLAGKALLAKADDDYSSPRELRATLTFTRQIAMFYKLDLMRHNHHAREVAEVLSTFDPNLRTCYTDRLEYNDKLKGDVTFTFLLSKETGTMSKLRHTGGTADDPKLVECIYYELAKIQFPVAENMLGELTYTYDVR
jgi:hypothetical protein